MVIKRELTKNSVAVSNCFGDRLILGYNTELGDLIALTKLGRSSGWFPYTAPEMLHFENNISLLVNVPVLSARN